MQIVIEISKERYQDIQRIAEVQTEKRMLTCEQIIANGTPIPEHATNGDVIRALFPDARVDDYDYGEDPVIDVYGIDDTEYITVRKNWWNAPYKKEGDGECI